MTTLRTCCWRSRPLWPELLRILFAIILIAAPVSAAQDAAPRAETPAQPAEPDAEEEEDDAPQTAERYAARAASAQSRLDALAETIPDEALRARVAEQLKEAAADWQAAARAAEQYARRRQTVDALPARLEEIRTEIEAIRAKTAAAAQGDAAHSIADLEAELRDLDVNLPEWNKQRDERRARIDSQSRRLAASRQAAEEAQARIDAKAPAVPGDLPQEAQTAMRGAQSARLRADREIVAGNEYYRNIQEPLAQLDAAELDLVTRRIDAARARRDQITNSIADKRRDEAEALRRESEAAAARYLDSLPESFRTVAEENRELSTALDAFLAQEKERAARLQSMSAYNQTLQTDFDRIREQLASGSGGQALGSYLWAKRRSLQREAWQADQERAKLAEAPVPGFTLGTVDELRRRIPALEQELSAFAGAPETKALPEARRSELLEQARKLLDSHARLVSGLSESSQRRSSAMVELEAANRELHGISGRYAALVERYVLSLPGSPPLWGISFVRTFRDSLADLSRANLWRDTAEALIFGVLRSPWLLLFLALAALPLLARRFLPHRLAALNLAARKPVAASPKGLLWRACEAFVKAYPPPLALFAAGAAVWSAARPGGDAAALGEALLAGALPWLLLNLWRGFCAEEGFLELYGGMPRVLSARLNRRLRSILVFGLPLWIVVWFVQNRTEPAAFQALGGIVSLILAALAAGFWWLRMRPAVFLRGAEARSPLFWQGLHLIIMALNLVWLFMSLLGYNYGALLVISKAASSSLIMTAISVAALYWSLRLTRARERQRARAILFYRFSEERRRKRGENETADQASLSNPSNMDDPDMPAPAADLSLANHEDRDPLSSPAVSAAAESIPPAVTRELDESLAGARRLVRWLFFALIALTLLAQWSDIFPAQEWLARITVIARGEGGLTLRSLLRALIGGVFLYAVATPLGAWANLGFLGWDPEERGTRVATAALIRYAVLGVGAIWVAQELGMAWSDAQWLVAALSVGLGFGLQEIILNFVCGVILLFERPVRVGDMVTLSDAEGTISRINIRTTTIVDGDRRELIIPNKELVTGRVINWTLSDTITRVVITVGVGYDSDPELVQKLLLRAARFTEGVLDDPAPSVFFAAMGENSLNFDLRVHTAKLDDRTPVQHALRLAINRLFRKNNIDIPFPQLDVHMVPPKE